MASERERAIAELRRKHGHGAINADDMFQLIYDAGRKAGLEEAARRVETLIPSGIAKQFIRDIAAAIRALAEGERG